MARLTYLLADQRTPAPEQIERALAGLRRRPHGTLLVREDGAVLAFATTYGRARVEVPRAVSL